MLSNEATRSKYSLLEFFIASAEGNYEAKVTALQTALKNKSIEDIPPSEYATLFDHARRIEISRPNMLKSDAIPNTHKQRFLLGMKDIITAGETFNREIVAIKTDSIKSDISSIATKPVAEKVTPKTPVIDISRSRARQIAEKTIIESKLLAKKRTKDLK